MFCGNCGKENKDGVKFCIDCGSRLEEAKNVNLNTEPSDAQAKGNNEDFAFEVKTERGSQSTRGAFVNGDFATGDSAFKSSKDGQNVNYDFGGVDESSNAKSKTKSDIGSDLKFMLANAIKRPFTVATYMLDETKVSAAVVFILLKNLIISILLGTVAVNNSSEIGITLSLAYNVYGAGFGIKLVISTFIVFTLLEFASIVSMFLAGKSVKSQEKLTTWIGGYTGSSVVLFYGLIVELILQIPQITVLSILGILVLLYACGVSIYTEIKAYSIYLGEACEDRKAHALGTGLVIMLAIAFVLLLLFFSVSQDLWGF